MGVCIGWDVGGAHLKAARAVDGRIVAVAQVACPLWQGIERLREAIPQALQKVGEAERHNVTTTGELSDIFPSRAAGVVGLAGEMAAALGEARLRFYAGPEGFVPPELVGDHAARIASANWHATAAFVAARMRDGLFVDIGSTTSDLIPFQDGTVSAAGYTDLERLRHGELVYTGQTRTFLMSVSDRAPFQGAWLPLMNEYFASMADVYRVLGELDEAVDQHPAADGREKTVEASRARLARMIGADAGDASDAAWRDLAGWFAESQLRRLDEAARQVLSAGRSGGHATMIGAGAGLAIAERLSARLAMRFTPFDALFEVEDGARAWAARCAPCVAIALWEAWSGAAGAVSASGRNTARLV